MNNVVQIFKPYTVPIKTLYFNESSDNEGIQCQSISHIKILKKLPSLVSNTDSTSIQEKSQDESLIKKTLNKKRGRKYKNLKECFKCQVDDCEILFEKNEELEEHMKTHQELFNCPYPNCAIAFMKETNCLKHRKSHLPSGKNYECPYPGCGKKFTASYNQKIHYRIHTGERPYKCEQCGSAYYDRANFKYHLRTAHLEMNSKDTICSHINCEHSFKTKKQKIMHHDKKDEECRMEKNHLIRLLVSFNSAVNALIKGPNETKIKNSQAYIDSQLQKQKTQLHIMDQEQYDALFFNKKQ